MERETRTSATENEEHNPNEVVEASEPPGGLQSRVADLSLIPIAELRHADLGHLVAAERQRMLQKAPTEGIQEQR